MRLKPALAVLAVLWLSACASFTGAPREAIVTAANPHAVAAGVEIIRRGGNATDAAIAASLVLGLVEPQSSGLGGGGFLLHFENSSNGIDAYDGREAAPMGATPDMFLQANGQPMDYLTAIKSGRSIGAPSLIPMLKMAHEQHGRLPWAVLFEPAIRLAEQGFAVSPRLNRLITGYGGMAGLKNSPSARAYLFDANGEAWPVGHILRNPEYATTLREIAARGPRAMQEGPIAEAIVRAAQADPIPGSLTLEDLQRVRPRRLEPICGAYRIYRVCSMPPPSSGGIAVIEMLGLYERARPTPEGAESIDDWAAYLWAARLAYADRDFYVADDSFAPVPLRAMADARYLDIRAREIDLSRAPREPLQPGDPSAATGGPTMRDLWWRPPESRESGTSHISIIDREGNVVVMTQTVEAGFGSQRMAAGFFLNNQLTDFSFLPVRDGRPVANSVAPGKRPRSSMAPTLILGADGEFEAAIGSPGGSSIISYVGRTAIAMTDWEMSVQDAINLPHLVATSGVISVETSVPAGLQDALRARGWQLRPNSSEDSGLHGFRANGDAGADPRREGIVGRVPPP